MQISSKHFQQANVLGIPVLASSLDKVARLIIDISQTKQFAYICIANVHMVILAKQNSRLRSVMENACVVSSDGMPLVWELRRQGFKDAERVAGPDLMLEVCRNAQELDIPIYFYGGTASVTKVVQEKLTLQFPRLTIAGIESPPQLAEQPVVEKEVVERINSSGAAIVFVGLGCPKQELWMQAYHKHIPAVLIGVGAAFDFFAGEIKRAPLWMQKSGLEWLHRLCSEPRRLWKRYLLTNTLYIYYLVREKYLPSMFDKQSR